MQAVAAKKLREQRGVIQVFFQRERSGMQVVALTAVPVEYRLLLAGLMEIFVPRGRGLFRRPEEGDHLGGRASGVRGKFIG